MEIKPLLEELILKVKDPSFSELATKFRNAIKQSRGYTADEKHEFYAQYKQLWDERKAWLENRKKEQEQKTVELDYLLDVIERMVEANDYMEQAKLFEKEFRYIGYLAHDKKDVLWQRYEKIRDLRKVFLDGKREVSGSIKNEYEREIVDLDVVYEGAPHLQESSHWEKIGSKIKQSRDTLRDIRKKIENDNDMLRPEKRLLYELIDSVRQKIKDAEEETFNTHGQRAAELLEEAKLALTTGNFGKTVETLKSVQSQIRMLWLRKGEKDKYINSIEELWASLKDRRKEKKQQFHDWLDKQKDGLEKLLAVKAKAEDALQRVQKNIEDNRSRLADARSEEFSEKVDVWIKEGEAKEADIQKSLEDLTRKINEIEDKLKKHGLAKEKELAEAQSVSETEVRETPTTIEEQEKVQNSEPVTEKPDEPATEESPIAE